MTILSFAALDDEVKEASAPGPYIQKRALLIYQCLKVQENKMV